MQHETEPNFDHLPKGKDSAVRAFAQQAWSLPAEEFISSNKKPTEHSLPDLKIDTPMELKKQQRDGHGGTAREQLSQRLDQTFDKETSDGLKQHMDAFEKRASGNQLNAHEVPETYRQIRRIISDTKNSPLTAELKKQVVRETLRHCADPEIISQGGHNTCNVTAVQVRAYTLHPSKAAKLIADVATSGEYETHSGIKVKLDAESMVPDKEARHSRPDKGERDYATQLFNLAAVNIWYSKAKPEWHYQQRIDKDEKTHKEHVREEIVDRSGPAEKPVLNPYTKKPLEGPTLAGDQIAFINDAIVGKHEPYAVLTLGASSAILPGEKAQSVHAADIIDESHFTSLLQDLKSKHQLPAIAGVETGVYPLNIDAGTPIVGYDSGGHVVNITDYTGGKKPHVSFDNEWSPKEDHLNKSVSLHDMYLCIGGVDAARLDAACDVLDAETKHKPIPPVAEMSKLASDAGRFGADSSMLDEAAKKIRDLAGSEKALHGEDRTKWFSELRNFMGAVTPQDKVKMLNKIQDSGVCTNAEIGWLTSDTAKAVSYQKRSAIKHHDEEKKRSCIKATTQVAEFVLTLHGEAKKHYFEKLREND